MTSVAYSVPEERAGERLDRFLASLPEVGSRASAAALLAAGAVEVDGEQRPKSFRLLEGAAVRFEPPAQREELQPESIELLVRWEDDALLVVDKPAGISVHPGAGRASGTLVNGLLARGAAGGDAERPGIVHRLDKDTSGLLVVTKSEQAHAALSRMVKRRQLERHYLALIHGRPRSRGGTIEAPIGRDRNRPTRQSLDTDTPRDAVTHFEVAELLQRHALLDVRLETGRTHQIRVHLAAIGLPISGDPTYGLERDLDLDRQFLHAYRLAFDHPTTGERVDVESPLPDDLARALEVARREDR